MNASKKTGLLKLSALAVVALSATVGQAAEFGGLNFEGYTRGGFYSNSKGMPKGHYGLGGSTQMYRLGNEGDNGLEVGISKKFGKEGGPQFGVLYMHEVWNGNDGPAQAYATMSGLDFAPSMEFWAGQRRLRIQDVHVVDHFFANYGDNYGAGFTGLKLGDKAKLGISIFNSGSLGTGNGNFNNAKRVSAAVSDIPLNPGGTLVVHGTLVKGDFLYGKDGVQLGLVHNQQMGGLKNSLFLEVSSGHAGRDGRFMGLGDGMTEAKDGAIPGQAPGNKGFRIVESPSWQYGPFGGQAILAYESGTVDGGPDHGVKTKDLSLGGRISYAVTNNFKLLAEAGTTSRKVGDGPTQRLNKFTIAPALALEQGFWARPELRLYATRVNWNEAAPQFSATGKKSATLFGVQMEVWW